MSAAQGSFVFAAINAADFPGFSTALSAQLSSWRDGFEAAVEGRFSELMTAVEGIKGSVIAQGLAFEELANRITRVEITGNQVVASLANWATQSDEKMRHFIVELDERGEEIRELARHAQTKFLEVAAGSESLRADFRTFASQSDARFQTLETRLEQSDARFQNLETRLDDLAVPAMAAEQDPWWRGPAGPSREPWSGGVGAAQRPDSRRAGFNIAEEDTASEGPAQLPGFAEPRGASAPPQWQPTWHSHRSSQYYSYAEFKPDLGGWKETKLDLNVNPQVFNAWQTRAISVLSSNRVSLH